MCPLDPSQHTCARSPSTPPSHPQLLLEQGLVPTGDEARDVLTSMARAPSREGWQTAWQVLSHTHSAQQLAQLTSVEPFYLLPRGVPPAQAELKRRVVEVRLCCNTVTSHTMTRVMTC